MSQPSEKQARDGSSFQLPHRKSSVAIIGSTSPGVKRIEAISRHIGTRDRIILFVGVFIIAYAYSLDSTLRYAFQPTATNSFQSHSLLATVTVLRGVIAAAAQPTSAKIADVFGRVELLITAILFYIVGTIVDATSAEVQAFSAGAVLYQVGFTCISFLAEIIIADLTSLRSRLFFSYIPPSPFIINAWVSGDVSSAVLNNIGWRWGVGMWAIIMPVCALPLILALLWAHRNAKRKGDLADYKTPYQTLGVKRLLVALFWQLDVIGVLLLIAAFALLLVPFTIAGGVEAANSGGRIWHEARILAPLIIGILCIPFFVFWERKAPHPLAPAHLLKDRAVWGALGIAFMVNASWALQGNYLYTVLQVAFDESILSATRITNLFNFTSVITGICLGLIVFKVRRLKWFIVFGTCLNLVAYGLLIQFRSGSGGDGHAGIVAAQVILGFANGFFPYSAQASIQAATRHEHLAVVTGLYLACFNMGGAFGDAIAGAIWTQILPGRLTTDLAPFNNSTLATATYNAPFNVILEYPWGTPQRDAIVHSYRYTQKILCITGICMAATLIGFALVIRNPRLTHEQSLANAEKQNDSETDENEV